MFITITRGLCISLLCTYYSLAAATNTDIQMIAFNCFTCHGEQPRSDEAVPSLHGLPGKYVLQAMQDYQADLRPGTIMPRISKAYTAAELEALADYFAQLKKRKE